MNRNTFRTLEFEKIRALLLNHAGSTPGKERARALLPSVQPDEVREALQLTTEGVLLLTALGPQPYHDLPDLTELLPALRVPGLHLEPRALLDIASFLEGSSEVARRVGLFENAPALAALARRVKDLSPLKDSIRRSILPTGDVADDASPRLLVARRTLSRLRSSLDALMESFLRSRDADRALQEKLVTTRNDRYVLVVKAEQRGVVPGIIHGSSGSGASLFVEPLAAVEINNDLVAAAEREREEVLRVLQALTAEVGREADALAEAFFVLGELDFVQAKALLARDMDAVRPELALAGEGLDLRGARHPLLMPALTERLGLPRRALTEPVAVDLRVGKDARVLVISGPNTGGKTVALKSVGLLALMGQSGLHIPAQAGSVLPVFRRIYADIGDDQSIAESLSTFSAHLKSIVEMTRDTEEPALVLLDEVGGGTDPTEGGPLGVGIVDYFRERGALVVATTHHGLLKAYAQSTPGVSCGSFGYEPDTYAPTYRLSLGVPGRSLALEMADRLGLPEGIVKDARSRLDRKEAQAEALLKRLEDERASLEAEKGRLQEERRAVGASAEVEAERERTAEERRLRELEAFRKELLKAGEEAARRMADAVTSAVQRVEGSRRAAVAASRARTDALRTIREAQEEALPAVGLPTPEARALRIGERVRVAGLGVVGEVLGFPGEGSVELAVSGKRLRVGRDEAVPLEGTQPRSAPAPYVPQKTGVRPEINLVGLTVEEAIPQVDKLLDDAALGDQRSVRVIHGFGSGRLKSAVASLLEGHPHVAAFRSGGNGEGGGGVTVVELKD